MSVAPELVIPEEMRPGSVMSRALCLRYVMQHPVGFRDFWVPKTYPRGFKQRYFFMPVVFAMDRGDTTLRAGRGTGKSLGVLEPEIVRRAWNRPGEETILTAMRRMHIVDRMERILVYFSIGFLRLYLKRAIRQPYIIELSSGHIIYGISVGDDPESKMIQGKHASTIDIEEAHQYPIRAWSKLQGARDPRGSACFMTGVPDGRLDTPFRHSASRYQNFAGRRFQISRRQDPNFTQEDKASFAINLGGETTDLFRQEVDAEWGNPVWSAWDMESLLRCVSKSLALVMIQISGRKYKEYGMTPAAAISELPGRPGEGTIRIALDVGYSQPSEVGVFRYWRSRWRMIARVRLFDRMEHSDQAAILDELGKLYDAESIGIDATEGEGRAIAAELEMAGWTVVRVPFTEKFLTGWKKTGEEVMETARNISIRWLRSMIHKQTIELPEDEEIPAAFNQETETVNKEGQRRLQTPPTVHIPEMLRVMAFMEFLANPPEPPAGTGISVFDVESGEPVWASAQTLY